MANTTPPPKSPEQLQLEKELEIEKLKRDIGDAQRAQIKAPEVTALQGNITSDGTFIESRILAGKTLAQAFRKLGKALHDSPVFKGKPKVQLLLLSSTDIALIESYAGIEAQL